MKLFLFTILFLLVIAVGVAIILLLNSLIKKIQSQTKEVNELNNVMYENLRELQFKSREINRFSKKLDENKNILIKDVFSSIVITFLPFKKLKAIILLDKFFKKIV